MSIMFMESDFVELELPLPGIYLSQIVSAEFRHSYKDHQMLQVVHELKNVRVAQDRVWDYFVLEGSCRSVTLARRRLVQLYRACGLNPVQGQRVSPEDLIGAHLKVRVMSYTYNGQLRLRASDYDTAEDDGIAALGA